MGDRLDERAYRDSREATPEAVPALRRAVVEFARSAGADEEQCEAVRLAVSEAVTNVVLHAYADGEPGQVGVCATVAGGELWVRIADDGRGLGVPSPRPGLGQGLALIGAVSDSISVLRRPQRGTELRLRFALRTVRAANSGRFGPLLRSIELAPTAA